MDILLQLVSGFRRGCLLHKKFNLQKNNSSNINYYSCVLAVVTIWSLHYDDICQITEYGSGRHICLVIYDGLYKSWPFSLDKLWTIYRVADTSTVQGMKYYELLLLPFNFKLKLDNNFFLTSCI